jgi:hypothetical protein
MARTKAAVVGERLAVIETLLHEHFETDKVSFASIATQLATSAEILRDVQAKMNRQRGIVTGAMFVASAVWAAVVALIAYWPFGK